MSATRQSSLADYRAECPSDSYGCGHLDCGETFDPHAAVKGTYCSIECYYRDRGQSVLEKIKHDHRLCATCFRQLKEVDRPPAEWSETSLMELAMEHGATISNEGGDLVLDATDCDETVQPTAADAVVGFQDPNQHAERAVDEHAVDATGAVREHHHVWACQCGSIDGQARDDVLEQIEREAVVVALFRTLYLLEHEGALPSRPDKDRLFDALRNHGRDWPYAIGYTVYG